MHAERHSGLAEYQNDEGLTFALWLKDGSIFEYNGRTGWTVEIDGRETEIDWDLSQMNGAYEDDFAYVESVVADPLAAAEDAVVTARSIFSHTAA